MTIARSIVVLLLILTESLALDGPTSDSAAGRLPLNYRWAMAQYIRTHNRYFIRDATISKPYEKYGGLFRGGTFPAVCIAIFRNNPFGIVVRDIRVLTIENGQVKEVLLGIDSCSDFSGFTELMQP